MGNLKLGILGAGGIAGVMAGTAAKMEGVELCAIGSRDLGRAKAFAEKFHVPRAYGSYEELVQDEEVNLIYVASPHSEHYRHSRLSLEHGKAVLCEKAFTVNAAQAKELVALAQEKKLLLAEAIWTRYMPIYATIKEVFASGIIGQPTMMTANLGYPISHVRRMYDPALAGGALLDLGIYTLTAASMLFGTEVAKIASTCTLTATGVDEQNSIVLTYQDGKVAVLCNSMTGVSDKRIVVYCTKGYAVIENVNNFESITVYDADYRQIAFHARPEQISGYEYELNACARALREGKIECEEMPHQEIIRVMGMMDEIRAQWGLKYPGE